MISFVGEDQLLFWQRVGTDHHAIIVGSFRTGFTSFLGLVLFVFLKVQLFRVLKIWDVCWGLSLLGSF